MIVPNNLKPAPWSELSWAGRWGYLFGSGSYLGWRGLIIFAICGVLLDFVYMVLRMLFQTKLDLHINALDFHRLQLQAEQSRRFRASLERIAEVCADDLGLCRRRDRKDRKRQQACPCCHSPSAGSAQSRRVTPSGNRAQ